MLIYDYVSVLSLSDISVIVKKKKKNSFFSRKGEAHTSWLLEMLLSIFHEYDVHHLVKLQNWDNFRNVSG